MLPEKLQTNGLDPLRKSPDDWLGLDNEKSESEELMAALGFARGGSTAKSNDPSLGEKSKIDAKRSSPPATNSKSNSPKLKHVPFSPPATTPKGNSQNPKQVPSSPHGGGDHSRKNISTLAPSSNSKNGYSREMAEHKTEFSFSSKPPAPVKEDPAPQPKSIFDALTFLSAKSQSGSPEPNVEGSADSSVETVTKKTGNVKKKVLKSAPSGSTLNNANTLHVPSHLVDEDELKTICSSLKSLYTSQLQLLETSYKEQIEILTQSGKRKEDILREEMKTMQRDYEHKIDRLKVKSCFYFIS